MIKWNRNTDRKWKLDSCINTNEQWEQLKIPFKKTSILLSQKVYTGCENMNWTYFSWEESDCKVTKLSKMQTSRRKTSKLVAFCFWNQRLKSSCLKMERNHFKIEKPDQDSPVPSVPLPRTDSSHPLSKPGSDLSHCALSGLQSQRI